MPEDTELLRPAEERAYRLLVRLSAARPVDLARVAAVSQEEAANLLEALRAKGLATAGPVFHPLPPDVALGDLLLRRQQALESARQVVAGLSEEYRSRARRRNADHLVEIVVGTDALRERLRDLQNTAQEEILWFCRANPIAMRGGENSEETPALARGVRYRAIYERALLDMPGELASILDGIGAGEDARTLTTLPVRLAIADRSIAICPLVPDSDHGVAEPSAALIRRSELLDALLALFESHWDRATPIAPDAGGGTLATDGV